MPRNKSAALLSENEFEVFSKLLEYLLELKFSDDVDVLKRGETFYNRIGALTAYSKKNVENWYLPSGEPKISEYNLRHFYKQFLSIQKEFGDKQPENEEKFAKMFLTWATPICEVMKWDALEEQGKIDQQYNNTYPLILTKQEPENGNIEKQASFSNQSAISINVNLNSPTSVINIFNTCLGLGMNKMNWKSLTEEKSSNNSKTDNIFTLKNSYSFNSFPYMDEIIDSDAFYARLADISKLFLKYLNSLKLDDLFVWAKVTSETCKSLEQYISGNSIDSVMRMMFEAKRGADSTGVGTIGLDLESIVPKINEIVEDVLLQSRDINFLEWWEIRSKSKVNFLSFEGKVSYDISRRR